MYVERDVENYKVCAKELLEELNNEGFDGSVQFITELKHTGKIIDQVQLWIEYLAKEKINNSIKDISIYLNMWHDFYATFKSNIKKVEETKTGFSTPKVKNKGVFAEDKFKDDPCSFDANDAYFKS